MLWSLCIFVRYHFVTWSCLLPIFSVPFLLLRYLFFFDLFVCHCFVPVHVCQIPQFFTWSCFFPVFLSQSFSRMHFFLIFLLPIFLFPVQFCKMPVFYLELFASHCFGPRRVFQLALFFYFCACHCFVSVHSCKMPVFSLELFASPFCGPIPFSKVPFCLIFLLPMFLPTPFLSDASFSSGAVCFRFCPSDSFF